MASSPPRPRLASHASVRRHLSVEPARSTEPAGLILHDLKRGGVIRIGEREWALLRAADGTRDLEGIRLAAEARGAHASLPAIDAFLGELAAAGLVTDGTADAAGPADEAAIGESLSARAVPIVALPGYRLACDGRGSCCRLYASVLFSRLEEATARALCPDVLNGGDDVEAAFTPDRGSDYAGALSVALVDGACAYVDRTGQCRIHAAGGAAAKPRGCHLFPALFVDDGRRVVVSPMLECACVFSSAGGEEGEPLIPPDVVDTRGLDRRAFVHRLPNELRVGAARLPRDEVTAWAAACLVAIRGREPLEALAALAASTRHDSLVDPTVAVGRQGDLELGPWLASLDRLLERRAREDARWRSPSDLVLQTNQWMREASATLLEGRTLRRAFSQPSTSSERFYVETALFGHHLLIEGGSLGSALLDRIVRMLLSRAMRALGPPRALQEREDRARAEPLALVEAMMRGHGLASYRPTEP
jgi:lysine-N-methylase